MSAVLARPTLFHQAGDRAARADIDPLDMAFAPGALVLLDVAGCGRYRYRVHGSGFVDRLGRELTGRPSTGS